MIYHIFPGSERKTNKNSKNYLDFIPIINPNISWYINEKNLVILEIKRNNFFDKIAQKLFNTPHKSDIKLDTHGSFVWQCLNGNKSVYDISKEVSNHFGKDAEPLLDRLVAFFNILVDNKFITFNKRG